MACGSCSRVAVGRGIYGHGDLIFAARNCERDLYAAPLIMLPRCDFSVNSYLNNRSLRR